MRPGDFVHLNCHSYFSLLFGGSSPEELVGACAGEGMGTLALTDRDGLYGAVRFHEAALRSGIKPITGCDLSIGLPGGDAAPGTAAGGARLILLARNDEGYRNLCRAVTERRLHGRPLEFEKLSRFSGGVFALCCEAELLAPLERVYGEHLFAELYDDGTAASHRRAERLIDAASRAGVGCAASNRVAFALPEDHHLHTVLCAIRLIRPVTRIPRGEVAEPGCHLRAPSRMKEIFAVHPYDKAPEAMPNTRRIADACNFDFQLGRRLFPSVDLPAGETAFSHLTKLCFEGAARKYRPLTSRVLERLKYELSTIEEMGFTPYFLVVHDISRFCREACIPAAGRGSAAGSMVAYSLGITYIDPIEHDLYFERFLSPAREDPPDIDLDISWRRRDEVLDYVYRRFGSDRVAMISTYATMKARMSVRDVARAMGLSPGEIDSFASRLPHCRASQIREAASAVPSCRDLPLDRDPYRAILETCYRLDGFPRHLSIHAGGVVIADRPLTDLVPLERAAKGLVVTQYDMGPIERLGLIKMDILGQKGLSVIGDTASAASGDEPVLPDDLPRDDPETFRLLSEGRTLGVFQIESPGMRSLLQAMKPESIEDLTLSIALIRPGASGSGMKELFLMRRAGTEPLVYLHPDLEPILSESLGTFVYQEQVMRAAVRLAGFSPAEADDLRRAMTHQRSDRHMEAIRARFLEGALSRGLPEPTARALFENLARFSSYGFPKAHAATYGEFSYQAAYLKAHFPGEFMAAVLSNEAGFYHHSVYVEEAKRLGVRVALPDINHSEPDFRVAGGVLFFGLLGIKGVSRRTVDSIMAARSHFPFTSLSDFLGRVEAGREEACALIKCGAFDSFENTRPELLWKLSMMYARARASRRTSETRADPGEGEEDVRLPISMPALVPPRALPRLPDYSRAQKLRMELHYLESSVTSHPLEILVPGELKEAHVTSADISRHIGREVTMVGWVIARRRAVTRKRDYMQFLTLEDLSGTFEVIIFPGKYRELDSLVGASRAMKVTGIVTDRAGSISLVASDLEPLASPALH
jgi:DNA-directed DNA polymerase III PolC